MNSPSTDNYDKFYDSDDEVRSARRQSELVHRARRTADFVSDVRVALVEVQLSKMGV
jgi:hypothetical protein